MAGDWIKMRNNLPEDPDVVRIARGLKLDIFGTVGRLHKIWAWADEHSVDGQDVPVDAEFLDSIVSTPGFSAQLRTVGWLSGRDGSLQFPNFLKHNGESAKRRAMDATRKKRVRKESAKCPHDKRTKSGPEERREEKSITLSHSQDPRKLNFPLGLGTDSFRKAWVRWCDWYQSINGNELPLVKAEADLKTLVARCGSDPDKAIADIDFSINVGSKSRIQDCDNDFSKQAKSGGKRSKAAMGLGPGQVFTPGAAVGEDF